MIIRVFYVKIKNGGRGGTTFFKFCVKLGTKNQIKSNLFKVINTTDTRLSNKTYTFF